MIKKGPPLTDWEEKMVDRLLKEGPLTSTDIIDIEYPTDVPFNARIIIYGKLDRIIRKLEADPKSEVSVSKSPRRGPHPIEYSAKRRKG